MGSKAGHLAEKESKEEAMVNISMSEIRDFLKKINQKVNQRIDFPRVSQWEFAYLCDSTLVDIPEHRSIILKKGNPSPFGICDLIGTVWQFCQETVEPRKYVLCGGSFSYQKNQLYSSTNQELENDLFSSDDIGCRLAISNP
jgi:hypothetical protein